MVQEPVEDIFKEDTMIEKDKVKRIVEEALKKPKKKNDFARIEFQLMEIPMADYSHKKHKEDLSLLKKELPGAMEKLIDDENVVFYKGKGFIAAVGSLYGKLTAFDEAILKAGVFSHLFEAKNNVVYLENRAELRKRLGIPEHGGAHLKMLNLALLKIANLQILHTKFYGKQKGEYSRVRGLPLFKESSIPLERIEERGRPIYLVLNDILGENIKRKYFKYISVKTYLSLNDHPIARRLYEYLEKKFGDGKNEFPESIDSLNPKIGNNTKNATWSRKILNENLKALKEKTDYEYKFSEDGKVIIFSKTKTITKIITEAPKTYTEQRRNKIFIALTKLNISTTNILSLFDKYSLDRIEKQLKYLPYRKALNKAGVLIESIKNNYPMPTSYERKIEEERRNR